LETLDTGTYSVWMWFASSGYSLLTTPFLLFGWDGFFVRLFLVHTFFPWSFFRQKFYSYSFSNTSLLVHAPTNTSGSVV